MTPSQVRFLDAASELWRKSGLVGRVAVDGNSMAPLLRHGDTVRLRSGAQPRIGDIVVAKTGDGLVVHRVLARRTSGVILRGDNSAAPDPPVPATEIIGRVTAVESFGLPTRRFDTPGARAQALAIAVVSRVLSTVGRSVRPRRFVLAMLWLERLLMRPMKPEDELVLLAGRTEVPEREGRRAKALTDDGLDEDEVVARALQGQLGPLLFVGVRQLPSGTNIPPELDNHLRLLYTGNWERSRRLRELLVEVLSLLEAEQIDVLGHKGAALTTTVYSDPALHICGDLDLSVRDGDRSRAEVATNGVRQPLAEAYPTRREPGGYHIELDGTAHHDLEPSLFGAGRWRTEPFDWESIWQRAKQLEVDGRPMLVPSPTDLLVTLTANAVRRGFSPVRLVANVAETIRYYGDEIDWQLYRNIVRQGSFDRRSWIALGFAADWYGADVPADALEPPEEFRPSLLEHLLLEWKLRRPFARLPTRVLWAGSTLGALSTLARLAMRAATARLKQ